MPRAVLLRHDLPDGSFHYDWMIQRSEGVDPPLITFRTTARIDQPGVSRFEAERLEDHRAVYLTREGPVSGGRGSVSRVATGEMRVAERAEDAVLIAGHLGRSEGVFEGRRDAGGLWRFSFTPVPTGPR